MEQTKKPKKPKKLKKPRKTEKPKKTLKTSTKCGQNKRCNKFANKKYKKYKKKGGEYDYGFNPNVIRFLSLIVSDTLKTIKIRTGITFLDFVNQHYDKYKKTFEITENILNGHQQLKSYYIDQIKLFIQKKKIDDIYLHMIYANRQIVLNSMQSLLQDTPTRNFIFRKMDNIMLSSKAPNQRGGLVSQNAPLPPPRTKQNLNYLKPTISGLKRADAINPTASHIEKTILHNLTFIVSSIIQYILNLLDKGQWFDSTVSQSNQGGVVNKANTSNFIHELFDVIGNNRYVMSYLNNKSIKVAEYICDKYLPSLYAKLKIFEEFFNDTQTRQTVIEISEQIEKNERTENVIHNVLNEYIKNNFKTKDIDLEPLLLPILAPNFMTAFGNLFKMTLPMYRLKKRADNLKQQLKNLKIR